MYALTYTIGGTTHNLRSYVAASGSYALQELGMQGMGGAPMHLLTTRGPEQQGTSVVGYRLDPRTLLLPLVYYARNHFEHYNIRAFLSSVFSPSQAKGTLTVTLPDPPDGLTLPMGQSSTRCIDVYVSGTPNFDPVAGAGYSVRTVVQFYADDPTWYDPLLNVESIASTVSGTPTAYAKIYPTTYGALTVNDATTISYSGSVATYPVIQVTGPVTNLVISNVSTGKTITFTGTIPAGRTWTLDLRYGYKTVKDDLGANQISSVVAGSALATWAIQPTPNVASGINVITVTGSGATSATSVILSYTNRYHAI